MARSYFDDDPKDGARYINPEARFIRDNYLRSSGRDEVEDCEEWDSLVQYVINHEGDSDGE